MLGLVSSALLPNEASADEYMQIECGPLSGKSYYLENAITPKSESGWDDEDLPGGTLHEFNLDTKEVVYRFKDASNVWSSSTDRGGVTELLNINEDLDFSHITKYANGFELEVVQITKLKNDSPKIMFTAIKNGTPFTVARVMVGECRAPIFFVR